LRLLRHYFGALCRGKKPDRYIHAKPWLFIPLFNSQINFPLLAEKIFAIIVASGFEK